MMHTPTRSFIVVAALALWTVPALASKRVGRARIGRELTHALNAAKATPVQRKQLEGVVEEVERRAEATMTGAADLEALLDLFARDPLDEHALDALKHRREAGTHELAESLGKVFVQVHDTLSTEQRDRVVDYARTRTEGKHMRAFKQAMITGLINAQIEDTLDRLSATDDERNAVHAVRDEVLTAVSTAQANQQTNADRLVALFRAESVDREALTQFVADKEGELHALLDTMERALVHLHAGLTPPHRVRLVEMVREYRNHPPTPTDANHTHGAF